MQWNEEQCQLVKDLWPTHSAGAIARKITRHCNEPITRNAVMGKAYRMQLTQGRNSKGAGCAPETNMRPARKPALDKVVRIRSRPPPAPQGDPFADAPLRARPCVLIELDGNRCHWPLGPINEVATLFCGGKARHGWPYCPHHSRIAYHPNWRRE